MWQTKANTFSSPLQPMFLTHICGVFAAVLYLSGLSDGMLPKASSGLGSGMGMMYSLYGVTTSCPSASCLRSPGLWLQLLAVGPGEEEEKATGDREPNVGLAAGKGEVRRGLVRATAGWSLFRKFSFTWLYLCWEKCLLSRIMWQKLLRFA